MKTAKEILNNFYREETAYVAAKASGQGDDPSAMLAWISPDVLLIQSPDLPWGGEWRGHKGFRDWAAQMGDKMSVLDVQDPVIYEASDASEATKGPVTQLLVYAKIHFRIRGTNHDFHGYITQINKINTEKEYIEEFKPILWNVGGLKDELRRAGHIQ